MGHRPQPAKKRNPSWRRSCKFRGQWPWPAWKPACCRTTASRTSWVQRPPSKIFESNARCGKLALTDITFRMKPTFLRIQSTRSVSAVGPPGRRKQPITSTAASGRRVAFAIHKRHGCRAARSRSETRLASSSIPRGNSRRTSWRSDDLVRRFGALFRRKWPPSLQAPPSPPPHTPPECHRVPAGTGSGQETHGTLKSRCPARIITDNRPSGSWTIEDTARTSAATDPDGRAGWESRPPKVEGKGRRQPAAIVWRTQRLRMRPDRNQSRRRNPGAEGSHRHAAGAMTYRPRRGFDDRPIHANEARDAISRLENMVAMA